MDDDRFDAPIGEEELVFYYDRKKRLERASDNVRRYYDGTAPTPPKGLFKALVHTKHSRYMLFALVLALITVGLYAFFAGGEGMRSCAGMRFELSAFSFEDSVYVTLKAQADANPGRNNDIVFAGIVFSALGKEKKVLVSKKNELIYDGNESYCRTIFSDYDIVYVQADIGANGEKLTLRTRVVQK